MTGDGPMKQCNRSARVAVITGTGGLGLEVSKALLKDGFDVVLAGRNPAKGNASVAAIKVGAPAGSIRFEHLDLGSLASIRAFALRTTSTIPRIDVLVNNAGIMMPPKRATTSDGFEIQFGTNHLGHFALTALLLDRLRNSDGARVVNVSSNAHKFGRIAFDDLQSERSYSALKAYAQSKLAVLIFVLELQRRSDDAGWGLMSVGAHPGFARTQLVANGLGNRGAMAFATNAFGHLMGQSAAQGALPLILAATGDVVREGGYYGPDGLFETRGAAVEVNPNSAALDLNVAKKLWKVSELLTGEHFLVSG